MAFGVKRAELENFKRKAAAGEIAILTHYWLDKRFPDSKTVTKVASKDKKTLRNWGKKYGLHPEWIDDRHRGLPHYDLFGDIQVHVLEKEGKKDQLERFHLKEEKKVLKLENEQIIVEMKEQGAELTSIYHKGNQLEYLWNADPAFWGRHAPVLFPTVGKLINDTYYVSSKAYHLGQHGFARDRRFEVIEQTATSILFCLEADDKSKAIYPYAFALRIRYQLEENRVKVSYEVENTDNERIYFSIGAHPAFNVPLASGENFEDYYLDFKVDEPLETLALEGAYRSGKVNKLVQKSARELPLTYELFKKDALIFEGLIANEISIRSRVSDHFVTVDFPDFPFVGVWTPKPGAPFLCIEPWFGVADSVGDSVEIRDKAGIEHLDPEAIFGAEYTISIG